MPWFISAILLGIITFVITNIDDVLVLAILFAHVRINPDLKKRYVVIGQYLGFMILIAVSLLIYLTTLAIPLAYIGLLGFIPIIQGVWGVKKLVGRSEKEEEVEEAKEEEKIEKIADKQPSSIHMPHFLRPVFNARIFSIITITLGNGADSLSIYPPVFARGGSGQLSVIISVFLIMLALWCLLGSLFTRIPGIARILERYGHYILPPCLISLGSFILASSGTVALFLHLITASFSAR